MGWTADEVADFLGHGWTIEVAQARPRPAIDAQGRHIMINDALMRAATSTDSCSASAQRWTDSRADVRRGIRLRHCRDHDLRHPRQIAL